MSETEIKAKPKIDITTQEGRDTLFQMRCIALGVDPKQVQSLAKFTDFDKSDERSFYPNQLTSMAVAQLRSYGRANYSVNEWNPYAVMADFLAGGFMGYKGFKSNQYVEITSGTQNLEKLQGIPDDTKRGLLSGLYGGKKE